MLLIMKIKNAQDVDKFLSEPDCNSFFHNFTFKSFTLEPAELPK